MVRCTTDANAGGFGISGGAGAIRAVDTEGAKDTVGIATGKLGNTVAAIVGALNADVCGT